MFRMGGAGMAPLHRGPSIASPAEHRAIRCKLVVPVMVVPPSLADTGNGVFFAGGRSVAEVARSLWCCVGATLCRGGVMLGGTLMMRLCKCAGCSLGWRDCFVGALSIIASRALRPLCMCMVVLLLSIIAAALLLLVLSPEAFDVEYSAA